MSTLGRTTTTSETGHPESTRSINGIPVLQSIPLRGIQATVAKRMAESRQTAASVTAMSEVDATTLQAVLRRLRARVPELSLTHLLIKATALCLRQHPRLNATLADDTIHELAEINIAVALSLPSDDLVVATIRNADEKSLQEIVVELGAMRARAAAGKLTLTDMRGGTFTLSNYGSLRTVVWATPIISPGQVGVLGVARIQPRFVPDSTGEQWVVRPILPLSLTYDHRVVNGVPAGRFIDSLADLLSTDAWTADKETA